MPWRGTRDPYRVWLSEVMLQQTQVVTVIPYFERFLKNFPTVRALAAAPLDDVLKLWAGLGYYSRARNLHRAAQMVARDFDGKFPDGPESIRTLPGIGAYTAGAVLSIAYGKPEALVDGNVARVLARLFKLEGDWRGGEGKKNIWNAARAALSEACAQKIDPGDFNQALMELGATICSPRSPDCGRCPVARHCAARIDNCQADYPQLNSRAASPEWHLRAWAVRNRGGKILLARRADKGLFGGMWELPTERLAATKKSKPFKPPSNIKTQALGTIRQVLTHRILNIDAVDTDLKNWRIQAPSDAEFPCWSGAYTKFYWSSVDDARAGKVALHASQLKILALLADKDSLFD